MSTEEIEHRHETPAPVYEGYFAITQTRDFLEHEGIDVDYVRQLPSVLRLRYLEGQLFTREEIDQYSHRIFNTRHSPDEGLVAIKPELAPFKKDVMDYLAKLGLSPSLQSTRLLTKNEWLSIYGYMIPRRPAIINMYISHCALGITPVRFTHLSAREYVEIKKGYCQDTRIPEDLSDINSVFDQLFCGSTVEYSPGTIRWDVAKRKLATTTIMSVLGDSIVFDPVAYYADGHQHEIPYAFNGIHVPRNSSEASHNLRVLGYE